MGGSMIKILRAAVLLLPLLIAGCATSLLDDAQKRIAGNRHKILKSALPEAYGIIEREANPGALILFNGSATYTIVGGASPIDAIGRYSGSLSPADAVCIFVFSYRAAIPPMQMSCASIKSDADAIALVKSSVAQLQSNISKTNSDISQIRSAISTYDAALTTSFRMGLVNSDLLAAHRRQLAQLSDAASTNRRDLAEINSTLVRLVEEFKSNTAKIEDAIAKLPK